VSAMSSDVRAKGGRPQVGDPGCARIALLERAVECNALKRDILGLAVHQAEAIGAVGGVLCLLTSPEAAPLSWRPPPAFRMKSWTHAANRAPRTCQRVPWSTTCCCGTSR
jgi:hypothetical protein